jgi:hypothetical protein
VKWTETVEVIGRGNAVVVQVMTKAGRLYRSTSFRLTKKEAAELATELMKASAPGMAAQPAPAADGARRRR